jgi:hypothetical protein
MERRKFIALTAIGSTATVFTSLRCNPRQSSNYAALEKPEQLSLICDEQTIREIGMTYRLQRPEENETRKLENLLSADSAGYPLPAVADDQKIRALLSGKVAADFAKSNTVVIKGWILSVTEARQCALFALHNQ